MQDLKTAPTLSERGLDLFIMEEGQLSDIEDIDELQSVDDRREQFYG